MIYLAIVVLGFVAHLYFTGMHVQRAFKCGVRVGRAYHNLDGEQCWKLFYQVVLKEKGDL